MADRVNLDALIKREDFLAPEGPDEGGQSGKASASITDLTKGESFWATLRKPDFQRETAAWAPEMICDFVKAFIEGDLIPSAICWQSPSRLTFVIDGAHRLSAIMAWILDDYGDKDESISFYGGSKIPAEQERIARKTRDLIDKQVGAYVKIRGETKVPGSAPEYATKARALAHSNIPLLWVKGSDPLRAEKAFFAINQSAVEIDPTELKILNARTDPNAIAARAVVRNAGGHAYWSEFSASGQSQLKSTARDIYAALYDPPLNPPIRTEELPIAGHGYGSQTLPLIFDCVNIANDFAVVDASKRKRNYSIIEKRPPPDEAKTIDAIKGTEKIIKRITGTHPSSLGLHPAVYFYARNSRRQPTAVLAIIKLIRELERHEKFIEFSKVRSKFEEFLIKHKSFINQLTVTHGSMVKGFLPIKEYYDFVLEKCHEGLSQEEIELALARHSKYQRLVKDKPAPSIQNKRFSNEAKQVKLLEDVLKTAFVCNICGARIDKKSMQLDHVIDKSKGGAADIDNSQWTHPFCNSTFKYAAKKR